MKASFAMLRINSRGSFGASRTQKTYWRTEALHSKPTYWTEISSRTILPETEIFASDLNLLLGLRQESRALSRHLQQDAFLSTQDTKAMTRPSFCTSASERVYITTADIAGVILGVRWIRQKLKL